MTVISDTNDALERRLGSAVRRWRIDAGYSQAELAARAGLSRSAVAALETGGGSRLTSLIRVLRALGRSDALDALTPDEEPSPMELLAAERRAQRQRRPAPRVRRRRG